MRHLHTLLTPKSQALNWNDDALTAFKATKEALANASLLSYPKNNAPTCLMMDASDTAVGAVLQQYVDGTRRPISFFSRKMTPAETHYSTFDRELLAVYLAIKHFRHFLKGRRFHVLTDHKPLPFALNTNLYRHSPWTTYLSSLPPSGTLIVQTTWLLMHSLALRLTLCSLVSHQLWTLLL